MTAPDIIKNFVQRFEANRESYRSGKYNETRLRREVASTHNGVDKLVYELYGLSEEEIKIVEGK